MNWFLLLHIATMLFWCASLLYLPALISGAASQTNNLITEKQSAIPRLIFTLILTPAALITIVSGTIVFVQMNTVSLWLIAKLTLVSGLVICHALNGWLIIKMENIPQKKLNAFCWLCGLVSLGLILAILWLVLAKPSLSALI